MLHDPAPVAPLIKLRQIVSPHQPDKPHLGIHRHKRPQSLSSIARARSLLEIADFDTRMLHHIPRPRHPLSYWRWPFCLQRIAGAYQPPDLIKPKSLERLARDVHMPLVRRVKRAAQQPDHPPVRHIWQTLFHPPVLASPRT